MTGIDRCCRLCTGHGGNDHEVDRCHLAADEGAAFEKLIASRGDLAQAASESP